MVPVGVCVVKPSNTGTYVHVMFTETWLYVNKQTNGVKTEVNFKSTIL